MGTHWDAAFTRWWPHRKDDQVFPLSHLHPFEFTVEMPPTGPYSKLTVHVLVAFSMHCFTRSWRSTDDVCDFYQNERERRVFDVNRYELSKQLPGIMRTLNGRKIYFSTGDNFLTLDLPDVLPPGSEYRIFFNLRRFKEHSPKSVLVVAQSAYAVPTEIRVRGRRAPPIGFRVLLKHALAGTKPKRPA